MTLETELKKRGYIRWDSQEKPLIGREYLHRWYEKNGKWVMEYYIKNEENTFQPFTQMITFQKMIRRSIKGARNRGMVFINKELGEIKEIYLRILNPSKKI